MIVSICDILYRNKIDCKLFNASSSELYKGHQNYMIKEDDPNMLPTTMYAICKSVGHQILDSYRKKYNLPFSNGILFMTESKKRSESFLLKKVAIHAKSWHKGNRTPLSLGNLESFRNINHCQDIADAIKIILEQPNGDTYLVCGSNFEKVEDLVIKIYKLYNIILIKEGSNLIDVLSGITVVLLGTCLRTSISAINGTSVKLRALGWDPKYTTQAILEDITELQSDSTISLTNSVNSTS
jgi:GDP-D-mannose dehydratase